MGIVYKARDLKLGREVALKFLSSHLSQAEEEKARFIREAKTASALDHPNICTIYEINETDDGQLFIAMSYYDGESLKDKINAGALPVGQALNLAIQIAQGLEKAHSKDIVHRDIKPANILLNQDGQVKIVDFGLAKLTGHSLLTKEGATLGTIAYMSPEQTQGSEVDHRTDIWALGVVLYEMVSGQRPFRGDYDQAVMFSILNEDPAPLEVPELEPIMQKILAKKPENRYQNLSEFISEAQKLQSAPVTKKSKGHVNRDKSHKPKFVYAAIALIILILVLIGIQLSGEDSGTIDSIAVLPLKNFSGEAEQEYFADGMTEELINTLGRVKGLRVAARTSSFAFKDKELDIKKIGNQLNVASILEGGVHKSHTTLRVTVQLISVADGYQLWSETYDRELSDIFAIQDDISQSITDALRFELVGEESTAMKSASVGLEAYEHYLKGRHFWNRRTQDGLKLAVQHFQQAVELSPNYAKGYAGLADAYCILGFYDWLPPSQAFPKARQAAERALELDPALAESHNSLGYIALYYEWDFEESERQYKRAIEINPRYPVAHQWYANLLTALGRFDEAEREMRRGMELDPLSLINSAALGWVYYHAGRYPEALRQYQTTLELDSSFVLAHFWMGQALEASEQFDAAIEKIMYAMNLAGGGPTMFLGLAHVFARTGKLSEARKMLSDLESGKTERYLPAYEMAKAYLAVNEKEKAFDWFETAYEQRSHSLVFLKVDPQLKEVQSDPRFKELATKVGLE